MKTQNLTKHWILISVIDIQLFFNVSLAGEKENGFWIQFYHEVKHSKGFSCQCIDYLQNIEKWCFENNAHYKWWFKQLASSYGNFINQSSIIMNQPNETLYHRLIQLF